MPDKEKRPETAPPMPAPAPAEKMEERRPVEEAPKTPTTTAGAPAQETQPGYMP